MIDHSSQQESPSDVSFVGALRRRWWIPVLCALAAGVAAYALTERQDTEFRATALLAFQGSNLQGPTLGADDTTDDTDVVIATRVALLERERVALGTLRRLNRADLTVGEVQEAVTIGRRANADVLAVQATQLDAVAAARMANAYARTFIEQTRAVARRRVRAALDVIEGELRRTDDGATRSALLERRTELLLLRRLGSASVTLAQAASPPATALTPGPARNTFLGLLLGGLLGLGLVALLAQSDRRLRDVRQVERSFGARVLAHVPSSRDLARGKPFGELGAKDAEPFRLLHAQLRHRGNGKADRLVVTSSMAAEGKTTTAWNLANAAAAAGERVILIEADVRHPSIAARYSLDVDKGLVDVLSGDMNFADAVQKVPVGEGQELHVVVSGETANGQRSVLMHGEGVSELLDRASRSYSLVVVDTPPVTIVSDAIPFAKHGSEVVAVAREGSSTESSATHMRDELRALDVPLTGIVAIGYSSPAQYGYYE